LIISYSTFKWPKFGEAFTTKHGLEFSYSDIPNFRWKIKLLNILEISSPETGTIEDFFYFKSDTLVIKTQLGYSTILVKDDL